MKKNSVILFLFCVFTFSSCSKAPTTIAYLQYAFDANFYVKGPAESRQLIEKINNSFLPEEYITFEYSWRGKFYREKLGDVNGDLSYSLKAGKLDDSQFDITDFGYVDKDYFKILKINTALKDTTVLTEWKMSELDVSKRSIFNTKYWISSGTSKRTYYDYKPFVDDYEIEIAFILIPEDFGIDSD